MISIFSPPKPFQGHIDLIQRNAIQSWLALGPDVEVILVGEEEGMESVADEYGVTWIRDIERNDEGTPLLDDIFRKVQVRASRELLCYANADVLFVDDLLPTCEKVHQQFERFLIVGQRWDLDVKDRIDTKESLSENLRERLRSSGQLHPPMGSDYFVFPRGEFSNMPPFALGRAGWDNWMIYAGRSSGIPVIDATGEITCIHQDHDYAHLPDGKPHYRLPESEKNIELAGGREMIFTLSDANWRIERGVLRKKTIGEMGLFRWIETGVYSTFGPGKISRTFRLISHPITTFKYFRHKYVEKTSP